MTKSNIFSQLFGSFASKKFSKHIQDFINCSYVKIMNLDMSEFSDPCSYESLNALFTRRLKKPRNISESGFISPSDGLVSEFGEVKDNLALQIKGFSYNVDELIDSDEKCKKFLNIYLSPRDYHRYHAPCDMQIINALYIPGALYPVNFTYLQKIPQLFCKNERVVLKCKSEEFGEFFMVFVGALNVGKMVFCFDDRIDTNAKINTTAFYAYDDLKVKKADELGYFKMGSTIVILTKEDINFKTDLKDVKFGQSLI